MKRGWIVYDEIGARKNEWFIARLKEELAVFGVELSLRVFHGFESFFEGDLPDFAVVRSILPQVNKRLETLGVRVFNNSQTAKIACDKWETYSACKAWGIPVLPTVLYGENMEKMPYPCVMKTRDGHGGEEVFWVENQAEAEQIFRESGGDKGYILQKPNEILGRDMRVYAIGGEIVASVLRKSEKDFRSNFSLGGVVEYAQADEMQKKIVRTLYEKLQFDYIGVDFMPTKNGWVLNELEDSAGARMLYSCSDFDVVKAYAEYIAKQLNG